MSCRTTARRASSSRTRCIDLPIFLSSLCLSIAIEYMFILWRFHRRDTDYVVDVYCVACVVLACECNVLYCTVVAAADRLHSSRLVAPGCGGAAAGGRVEEPAAGGGPGPGAEQGAGEPVAGCCAGGVSE